MNPDTDGQLVTDKGAKAALWERTAVTTKSAATLGQRHAER